MIYYQALAKAADGSIFVRIRVIDRVAEIRATGCDDVIIVPEGQAISFEISAKTHHDVPIIVQAWQD